MRWDSRCECGHSLQAHKRTDMLGSCITGKVQAVGDELRMTTCLCARFRHHPDTLAAFQALLIQAFERTDVR